jgi:membrane protein DedA with SNARE-associated domain
MTEALIALVPVWGIGLVAVATFLSCLALPVPSSLVMLAAGGFAASGDLALWQVALAALAGAVAGDQVGYRLGRIGGRLAARGAAAEVLGRARALLEARGPWAVFFSRWLVSPLGPYVNFAAGAARLPLARFTPAAIAGEIVWVAIYVGLGAAFSDRILALADILGSASGLLAALAIAALLGLRLRSALRQRHRETGAPPPPLSP